MRSIVVTALILTVVPYLIGLWYDKTHPNEVRAASILDQWILGLIVELCIAGAAAFVYGIYDLVNLALS